MFPCASQWSGRCEWRENVKSFIVWVCRKWGFDDFVTSDIDKNFWIVDRLLQRNGQAKNKYHIYDDFVDGCEHTDPIAIWHFGAFWLLFISKLRKQIQFQFTNSDSSSLSLPAPPLSGQWAKCPVLGIWARIDLLCSRPLQITYKNHKSYLINKSELSFCTWQCWVRDAFRIRRN